MMLPSYALYKKLYLLSFIILFYLSIVAEACCLLLEAWALSLARRLVQRLVTALETTLDQ